MPATVSIDRPPGPVTRALVIGVGRYPALPNGGGPQMARPEGMRQLESPPVSARAFARWLLEGYASPSRPLASVHLLISEATPQDFTYTYDGVGQVAQPQSADLATVRQAIREWRDLSTDVDDLMLFYFCGHGIANAAVTSLLMSDFGTVPTAPLDGALNFTGFRLGMESCTARDQCFFIDACRLGSTLLQRNNNYGGDPVLHGLLEPNPGGRARIGPLFYSTLAGESAYGRPGQSSVFTEALLEALSGCAASDNNGVDWIVRTGQLQEALQFLVEDAIRTNRWEVIQQPIVEAMQTVELNTLTQQPLVPVLVNVTPDLAHAEAVLRYDNGNGFQAQRPADPLPWSLRLPMGVYNFHADYPSARFTSRSLTNSWVRPPYQTRTLPAEPA
jgi:hypothetical protein